MQQDVEQQEELYCSLREELEHDRREHLASQALCLKLVEDKYVASYGSIPRSIACFFSGFVAFGKVEHVS